MSKISLFAKLPEKGERHKSTETLTIKEFLYNIQFGTWKDRVERVRTEEDDIKRKFLKTALPMVTISGTFPYKDEDSLSEYSGFICVDVDHYTNKSELINDPYTYALFKSTSGQGLAILVKTTTAEKHKDHFRWLQSHYFKNYGIPIDPAPSNVASGRFVSYDKDVYIRETSRVALTKKAKKKAPSLPLIVGEDVVNDLVAECVGGGHNIAEEYTQYRDLAFALYDGFGEKGRGYFHSLCSVSGKYESRHADWQYNQAAKGRKSGITVGTFYWMLKQVGITIPNDNREIIRQLSINKANNIPKENAANMLVKLNGLDEKIAEKIADEVYNREDISTKTFKGQRELIELFIEFMNQNHPIKKNTITEKVERNGKEITDETINSIYLQAQLLFDTKEISKSMVSDYIFSNNVPKVNPISEFIQNNRYRNSTGNIDNIIKSIRSSTPHRQMLIKKWLVSLIAAHNGYPIRSVLVLCGSQYNGKSRWFRDLLPKELSRYYTEKQIKDNKDDNMLMCQNLIIMDDEFRIMNKAEATHFKEMTSKERFSLRPPYGRVTRDYTRLCVFCGTSNDDQVINDRTGNTRIFPIKVDSIDYELSNSVDRSELFMELVREYEAGYDYSLSMRDVKLLGEISEDFETTNIEGELIDTYFAPPHEGKRTELLTATDIKTTIEKNSGQKIMNMSNFGIELKKRFGKSKSKKLNGVSKKVYELVRLPVIPI